MNHRTTEAASAPIGHPAAGDASPRRIHRQRFKGWRMPPNTVSVTRPGKWGNRFRVGEVVQRFSKEKICETFTIETNEQAVACFREYMADHLSNPPAAKIIREALAELRGKNLACWCKPGAPCHADVLLELANSLTTGEMPAHG